MKLFHELFSFFLMPVLGLHLDGGDGGGGGGDAGAAGAGAGAAGADKGAAGAGQGGGSAAGAGAGAAAGGAAAGGAAGGAGAAAGAHLGAFIDDKGTFKAGWSKAYGLPETLEQKFTTPEALLKSYVAAERMIGNQNKVAVPGPNATPEERAAFFKAIGRPDKPEDYGVKMPDKMPDGKTPFPKELWNEKRATAFAKLAHENGFTKAQVEVLSKFDIEHGLEAYAAVKGAQKAQIDGAVADLKKAWGADYDANLALAERAAKEIGLIGADNPELANNPAFIKAMAEVGKRLGEDRAAGARGTSHSQSDPKQQISAIMNDKAHPYWKAQHPEHANAVKQMAELRRLAHPEPANA